MDVPAGQISESPLRQANTRGSAHITGTVCSRKMAGPIDRVGPHELRFVIRAELDPRVTRILYQPVRYDFAHDGARASAYPDFLVEVDGAAEIHEVKPDGEYARPDVRRRLEATARAAAGHGHHYAVTLASELHRRTDKAAVDVLWRRVAERVAPIVRMAARDLFARGPLPAGEAVRRLGRYGCDIHDIHRLLAHGELVADLTETPDAGMIVHARDGGVRFGRLIPFVSPLGDRR